MWKIIENLDNSTGDYNGYVQKIMILQVIQQIFCEMLIGERKIVNSDVFFLVTNIRTNVQNYSSEFEGLIQKMVWQKPFINPEICHTNLNGESRGHIDKFSTVLGQNPTYASTWFLKK